MQSVQQIASAKNVAHVRTVAERNAKCVEVSKHVRGDIHDDAIRGRRFDFSKPFLPDGLSKVNEIAFLGGDESRRLSQAQGRTDARLFGLVERFVVAKVLEPCRWQYIVSGVKDPRFQELIGGRVNDEPAHRIGAGLAPILK